MNSRRVAITGIGVLSGYGYGTEKLWQGMLSGHSAIRDHRARFGGRAWLDYPMAFYPDRFSEIAEGLPNQQVVRHERLGRDPDLLAIAACVQGALADSGLEYDPERNDVGLVVTHESPGLADHLQGFFRWRDIARNWLRSPSRFNPPEFLYQENKESVYRLHSFLYIHYLAALFRLHGFSLYNNNACSSGAFAMAVAAARIRSGETAAVVVAGGDVPEDGTKYRWFADLNLYSRSGRCRPFETGRDGMVLGSGAAAFVLEDLDRALSAGRRVHAEWLGGGFSSEGWKITMPDVTGGHYAEAIERALVVTGVAPNEISLVTPHGVGTGMLDHFEAESLAQALRIDGRRFPPLMLVKAAVGHSLGGCVLLETAASLLALRHGELPAQVRCREPDPALPIDTCDDERLPDAWTLLKCTNGFAGQNAAILLRSVPENSG